jgi:hypothetical protein
MNLLRKRETIALVLTLFCVCFLVGCYGEFVLTKQLYQYNGDLSDDGYIQSGVLWVLGFLWVYPIAMVCDVAIFNLIEFWSGTNPLIATTYESPDGTLVAMNPSADGQSVKVDVTKEGQIVESRTITKLDENKFQVLDDKGGAIGLVRKDSNGDLLLKRSNSAEEVRLSHNDLLAFGKMATKPI